MKENLKSFLLVVIIPIVCVVVLSTPVILWKAFHG
jgi:hypothetical protein